MPSHSIAKTETSTMNYFYLLGGNGSCDAWWEDALPEFKRHHPIPLELPGFGNNHETPCRTIDDLADYILTHSEKGHAILATGVNALPVLQAVRIKPDHFSRVILLSPIGAYFWQRRLPKLMRSRLLRRLVHYLLSHHPRLFRRQFSTANWTDHQYARMGIGYRQCRAFESYWDIMQADRVLTLLDWIKTPVEIVWGGSDQIINWQQSAAWSAILARADLYITLKTEWGHYPWMEQAAEFVHWLESEQKGIPAHTKAGRLILAQLNEVNTPAFICLTDNQNGSLTDFLNQHPSELWAVRSSGDSEDGADKSHAGQSRTFLRVPNHAVRRRLEELLLETKTVIVQRYVEPVCSGVAYVRHLSAEIEWTPGHLECITDGKTNPEQVILSRLPDAWRQNRFAKFKGLTEQKLWMFFQKVVHIFHYSHCDIEWAWDGHNLQLLQVRPVTSHNWKRHLTAANISEILPSQPSYLMEYAQRRAAQSIPAILARWDSRVLEDNEPFTALYADASYINQDLFLARLADWGLSEKRYVGELGGAAPALHFHPLRLVKNLGVFRRMLFQSRQAVENLETELQRFDAQLTTLIERNSSAKTLANWFSRFYVFVVQGNLVISTAITTSGNKLWGNPNTVYQKLINELSAHRLPFETDPATVRIQDGELSLQAFPDWPISIQLLHRSGLPGLRAYYLQLREWYRDNLMRIFYRLHHAIPEQERNQWFQPTPNSRKRNNAFWQDDSGSQKQNSGFMIFPGHAEGILGQDILLVDTLDPGLLQTYRSCKAVISLNGGRLSHGATLLCELGKPSAVLPQVDKNWLGKTVRLDNGQLQLL